MERASFSPLSVALASLMISLGTSVRLRCQSMHFVLQITPQAYQVSMEMLFETGEDFERTEHCRVRFRYEVLPIANLDYLEAAFHNVPVQ